MSIIQKYEDVMVDLESLDTADGAVVISLGAVAFNTYGADTAASLNILGTGRNFYIPFNIQEQLDKGRTVDASTLCWWMKQETNARAVFQEQTPHSVFSALTAFSNFCEEHSIKRMWGNGNMFDNVKMRSLFDSFNHDGYPVDFRSDMDLRTYRVAAGSPDIANRIKRVGTHHNALDDAKYQVLCAQYYHMRIEA